MNPDSAIARDERLLQALHDGEASPPEQAATEAWLAEDADARDRLAGLAASDALLRRALAGPLDEPVPERLHAGVEAALAGQTRRSPAGHRVRRRDLVLAAALALALAVAAPAAWLWSAAETEGRMAARAEARAAALAELDTELQRTLETQASGSPQPWAAGGAAGQVLAVRTYKSSAGAWCREYRVHGILQGERYAERGIACRDPAGRWQRKVLLLDESAAAPPTGRGT